MNDDKQASSVETRERGQTLWENVEFLSSYK